MAKGPSMKDYGGNHYVTGRRGRTKLSDSDMLTFHCVDCRRWRYVTQRELRRAAQPRCQHCGGYLEETSSSRSRQGLPPNTAAAGCLTHEKSGIPRMDRLYATETALALIDRIVEVLSQEMSDEDLLAAGAALRRKFSAAWADSDQKRVMRGLSSAILPVRDLVEGWLAADLRRPNGSE